MKTSAIVLSILLSIAIRSAFAQSGTWDRAGNNLTGTEKFGSTNAKPVNFFTNNTQ